MEWSLAIIAAGVLGVASISRPLSGSLVTPTLAFMAFGLLVGGEVLGLIELSSGNSTVRSLAEAALTLVLFTDAARIDLRALREGGGVPLRLLGVGLPLTIAAGTLAAVVCFGELTLGEALIVAVILAPTDAALGQAVVTSPLIPTRLRQGLNVESGLNDGICVPLLFAAVAAADLESHISGGRGAGTLLLEEIGYGVLGGLVAGFLVAMVVIHAGRRGLIDAAWRQLIPAAGAALAYGIAVALDGSGFIASFVAGLVFRGLVKEDPAAIDELTEQVGDALGGVTFLLFGAILLGPAIAASSWVLLLYALLSLTVVRMAPVALAMLGSGARAPTVALLGWFGPRGLASIVFALIVVEESHLPHQDLIVTAVYLTVGLSVVLHGVSATPLVRRYGAWLQANPLGSRRGPEETSASLTRVRGRSAPGSAEAP
ncbi:MAG: sodium:proton antiporter [Actinobacteria bacterium]|nr:sodium:proton antiporter [Actinomycetota bacterium]